MSELKTFMVSSEDNQFLVVLEVDLAKLTAERALSAEVVVPGFDEVELHEVIMAAVAAK